MRIGELDADLAREQQAIAAKRARLSRLLAIEGDSTGTVRGYESSLKVEGERLVVPVGSQTNTRVTLREPITVTRPLGRTAEVRVIDFYAESPPAAAGRPSSAPGR